MNRFIISSLLGLTGFLSLISLGLSKRSGMM